MSEEEKKAIEELKSFINDKDCIYWIGKNGEEAVKIILNLIETQQKEIEELKNRIREKIEKFKVIRDTILEHEAEYKRPMMTYDLIRNDYCEKMLQELLEEKR